MSKLTLSIDPAIVSRAKRYAKRHRLSISQMVESYLASVADAPAEESVPPVLRSLRGILKNADPSEYRRHLVRKYR